MASFRRPKAIASAASVVMVVALIMVIQYRPMTDNHMNYVYEANPNSLMDPLVHKHQYRLSINNATICSSETFLLFLINSAPEHREKREMIRETWGSVKLYNGAQIRVVFLFGERPKPNNMSSEALNERLKTESGVRGDIIKGNFIDDYVNMTYKTVMGHYWMDTYCPGASFVMKADDDVLINIYKVVHFLQEINQTPSKVSTFFYGSCAQHHPHRSKSSKWYISYFDYPYELYPSFCTGAGYILSNEAAARIYKATPRVPYYWMDDVYIGFCAELANIEPIDHYYGYYLVLPWSETDSPWEHTILKVNAGSSKKSQETWAYLNSKDNTSFHGVIYNRLVSACWIGLLCWFVYSTIVAKQFSYVFCKSRINQPFMLFKLVLDKLVPKRETN